MENVVRLGDHVTIAGTVVYIFAEKPKVDEDDVDKSKRICIETIHHERLIVNINDIKTHRPINS